MKTVREEFDSMIGRLDRVLSEFLVAVEADCDWADLQTLKHHADDLLGVGEKAEEIVRRAMIKASTVKS